MTGSNATMQNIWMITREYGDIAGAGGVKDVVAQLSRALARWSGRKVKVVLPLYGMISPEEFGLTELEDPYVENQSLEFSVNMNYALEERRETLRVWEMKDSKVTVYFLDSPRFREKHDVYTYTAEEERANPSTRRGEGHYDYFAMNLLLQKGALQLILLLREKPDVIHCHDGHTAVLPAIIAETPWLNSYFRGCGCLVTVHNAGKGYHQEVGDLPYAQKMTGLPMRVILAAGLEDRFDPLIAAGHYALVNTVSENYARELQQTNDDERTGWLGHRLKDMGVVLEGITNGVDPEIFDPRKGEEIGLAAPFDPRDDELMAGKRLCKEDLLRQLSEDGGVDGLMKYGFLHQARSLPLFTFIGRLSEQKGIDILIDALSMLLERDAEFQMLVLGSGIESIENELERIAGQEKGFGRICFLKGYNPAVANRVYSGGDFFLVPSKYEPCGLTDFIAQLFGNLPIVHSIGGLVKVRDGETGFSYSGNTADILADTVARAISCYQDKPLLRKMQKQGVALIEKKYTWNVVMKNYLQLYKISRSL